MRYQSLPVLVFAVGALTLSGCTTLSDVTSFSDVKPWERNVLARDDMQLVSDRLENAVDEHLYFSKEASSGGSGIKGGGCGCN